MDTSRCVGNVIRNKGFDPRVDDAGGSVTWKRGGGQATTESCLVALQPDTVLDLKPTDCSHHTYIQMFKRTEELVEVLKERSAAELMSLMGLKQKIAESHRERFQAFHRLTPKQACLLLGGLGLQASSFTESERKYAEKHLRIVSGLYGVLRPYDDVRPVRDLPLGAALSTKKGKTVADFWGDNISKMLVKEAQAVSGGSSPTLLACCLSDEYWQAVHHEAMPADVRACHCDFQGASDEAARMGRGRLARHILRTKVKTLEEILEFDDDDWLLDQKKSSGSKVVFRWRGEGTGSRKDKKKKRKYRGSASTASGAKTKKGAKCGTRSSRSRSPSEKDRSWREGKREDPEKKKTKKEKQIEVVRKDGADSDDSDAFLIAPKKWDDAGVRESSQSPAKKKDRRRQSASERSRSRKRDRRKGTSRSSSEDRGRRGRQGYSGGRRS